jgi:hemerythrin-like domain-containing protein
MSASEDGEIPQHAFVEREHRELVPGIHRIHTIGGAVGSISASDLGRAFDELIRWIDDVLEPHLAWEEGWLYPELDERACTPWATRLMRFEHQQMRTSAHALHLDRSLLRHELNHEQATEVRAHLFGFEAVIRAHLEREKRILIPLLEEPRHPASKAASQATAAR